MPAPQCDPKHFISAKVVVLAMSGAFIFYNLMSAMDVSRVKHHEETPPRSTPVDCCIVAGIR